MAEADAKIDAATTEQATPTEPISAVPKPRRNWGKLLLMLSLPIALIIGGVLYWQSVQGKVSTDNAYVHVDKVSVSSQVGGKIVDVLVKENQHVKAGDLLFRIDPEQYQLQIAQADAAIATAEASRIALANSSALSGAEIAAAQEQIGFARSNLARQEALWKRGFTTKAAYEAAQHQVALAEASLNAAVAKRDEAAAKPVAALAALPYVEATLPDGVKTNSLLEAHRLNSPYILGDPEFHKRLRTELGLPEKKGDEEDVPGALDLRRLARVVFKFDPGSVLHGVFLEKIAGRLRLQRLLLRPSGPMENILQRRWTTGRCCLCSRFRRSSDWV